jgi:hypothetical protein
MYIVRPASKNKNTKFKFIGTVLFDVYSRVLNILPEVVFLFESLTI